MSKVTKVWEVILNLDTMRHTVVPLDNPGTFWYLSPNKFISRTQAQRRADKLNAAEWEE